MATIPAEGWWAVYNDTAGEAPRVRVAALELDESAGAMRGYVAAGGDFTRADQYQGFSGNWTFTEYVHDGDFAVCDDATQHGPDQPPAKLDQTGYDPVCGGVRAAA